MKLEEMTERDKIMMMTGFVSALAFVSGHDATATPLCGAAIALAGDVTGNHTASEDLSTELVAAMLHRAAVAMAPSTN